MRSRSSLTLGELAIVLCVVFLFLGVFATYAKISLRVARETALRNELTNIRMSIEHYRVINGQLPVDLLALMNQSFTMNDSSGNIFMKEFLKPFRISKQGDLLDPFMSKYNYSQKTGRVFSQTKEYRVW